MTDTPPAIADDDARDLADIEAEPSPADGFAIAGLSCAILSVLIPIVPAVAALYLAAASDQRLAEAEGRLSGEGLNQASRVIAWLTMAFQILVLVVVLASIFGQAFSGD